VKKSTCLHFQDSINKKGIHTEKFQFLGKQMPVSLFQLFSIGIGPSSSHTVGPMRAARSFALSLNENPSSLSVELFGSLAMTGKGHATDLAILLGLEGYTPETVDPSFAKKRFEDIQETSVLMLCKKDPIYFDPKEHLIFHKGKRLPYHSNAMRFTAYDAKGEKIATQIYYSVGGGFVLNQDEISLKPHLAPDDCTLPFPFKSCDELLALCRKHKMTIPELMMENEKTWRSEEEIQDGILNIWNVMKGSVTRGCQEKGILPGGLNVRRRASEIYQHLILKGDLSADPSAIFDWISLFALAVNEENAAGGRVVTAPTNGASGVIPAVLHYYEKFTPQPTNEGIIRFFLTATAVGILYKENASLSAAEMGCQGEVGVACSMAAAGLTAALNGTNEQIENAAEIGMEHNLGLTCDPIAGLVQIPCIERNTMGAIKAINASRLALLGNGEHVVSLDQVITTMRQTGEDMKSVYKETSEGGLALNVSVGLPEC
jgi:L-serine dehydratase